MAGHNTYPEGAASFIQFNGGSSYAAFDALSGADQSLWQSASQVAIGQTCTVASTCEHAESVYDLVGSGNLEWSQVAAGQKILYCYAAHWSTSTPEDQDVRRHAPISG